MAESNSAMYLPLSILLSAIIISGGLLMAANSVNTGLATLSASIEKINISVPSGNTGSGSGDTGNTQPDPEPEAIVNAVDLVDTDPFEGDPNAPVTIVEFSDFQCPFCGRFYSETLGQIRSEYVETGKVKIVFRDFPLSFHPEAQPASEAAECANEQGKFWEFHDKVFENQEAMGSATYKAWAAELGMNTEQFNSCVESGKYRAEVQADFSAGQNAGVSGTPTFFIGSQKVVGAQPFSVFKQVIDAELAN